VKSEPSKATLHQIRTLFESGAVGGLTDAQLLERFTLGRDASSETAFAALVERHGPMVLGVCRRVLGDRNDADDAFQVTFLILARKGRSIARRELLANWLHGVARRTAHEARVRAARRRAKERESVPEVADVRESAVESEAQRRELQALLDEELARLPDRYRLPLVLCELEGRNRTEAAAILGIPEGTLSSRLSRGREALRKRLNRRGLTLTAGTLGTLLSRDVLAGLPAALVETTAQAATRFAMSPAAAGAVSAPVATLAEGVLKAMLLTKLKLVVGLLMIVGVLTAGVGVLAQSGLVPKQGKAPAVAPGPGSNRSVEITIGSDDGLVPGKTLEIVRTKPWEALAREQLELARQALRDLDRMAMGGEVKLSDAKFALWERRQVEAIRDSGAPRTEFLTALEAHVKRLKDLQKLAEAGLANGFATRVDVFDVKYRILEAEIWLTREKAQAKDAGPHP
jgi:RNA polymerase sigma factor (sigma-70 family)